MILINPGSENKGGTFKQALENAYEWLKEIREEYPEVRMTTHENKLERGDWNFRFTHGITGKQIDLQIHGFTKDECEGFMFHPRVYWNGSSTADPRIEDWLTDDYTYRIVYERKIKAQK
jgi:hypothetical protein